MRHQVLVRFGYVGLGLHGLQPQPGLPTAGGRLKDRLEHAAGERPRGLAFTARTDAGVHARVNIATCYFISPDFDFAHFAERLARPRGDGLFSVEVHAVDKHVHARGASEGKRYRYIVDSGAPNAADRDAHDYSWRIAPPLDVERMRAAARLLEGEHDFSSLRAAGCSAATPVKTIHRIRVRGPYPLEGPGPRQRGVERFIIEVTGTAFLRKMMRNLAALVVEVGSGWRPVEDIPRVLNARDRQQAGLCAPPGGLSLMQISFTWPEDGSWRMRLPSPPEH